VEALKRVNLLKDVIRKNRFSMVVAVILPVDLLFARNHSINRVPHVVNYLSILKATLLNVQTAILKEALILQATNSI
jgi:hypothetical protein